MTALTTPHSTSAPPMVLSYCDQMPASPLIRVGRTFAMAAIALTILFIPIWSERAGWLDPWRGVSYEYQVSCCLLVPVFQGLLAGVGVTLVLVGRRQTGGPRTTRYLIAFLMNALALLMIAAEFRSVLH